MAFDTLESGIEIYFVSSQDPAIDWDETERTADFSKEAYELAPSEERAKALKFKAGELPTVFYLAIPEIRLVNKALREFEAIAALQYVAVRHIRRAENLKRAGKDVTLKQKSDKALDEKSENAIPTQVLHEIGRFLVQVGSGIERPLGS